MIKQVLLDVEGDFLLKAGKIVFLQQIRQVFRQKDPDKKKDCSKKESQLTVEDDVINNIAHYKRLRKTEQRGEDDESGAHHAFPPMPSDKRAQVLEISLEAGIALLRGEAVFWHLPGKTAFKIGEPVVHVLNQASRNMGETYSLEYYIFYCRGLIHQARTYYLSDQLDFKNYIS